MSTMWNFNEEIQNEIEKALDLINLGYVQLMLTKNTIEKKHPNQDSSSYTKLTKTLKDVLKEFDLKLKQHRKWHDYSKEEIVIALGKFLELCNADVRSEIMELMYKVLNNSVDENEKNKIVNIVYETEHHIERARKTKKSINF